MMKKTVLVLSVVAFMFAGVSSFAQTSQGGWIAGGSVGATFSKDKSENGSVSVDGNKHTDIMINPMAGYFFIDGFAAGLGLSINSMKTETDDGESSSTASSLLISPFARYYHDSGLFGHASVGFGSSKSEFLFSEGENKYNSFRWELGAGYAIFLNESIAIEPMLKYYSNTNSDDEDSDIKDINSGLMINVGFNIFIN